MLIAVGLVAAAFAMVYPVPFDNPLGLFGALLTFFPLHLLIVTAVVTGLALLARRMRARFAAAIFAFAALLSAVMALWPAVAMWRFARQQNVALSLGDYLAQATHLNLGPAQLDRTVTYGTAADGTKLLLDVWPAAGDAGGGLHPALVRAHGGAFIHGNRSDMPDWDRWFNERGYTVFDVEYRLPPPERWQDETGDVKCALGWVTAHAADYRIDPTRISVTGFSAGGTLAMLAAYSKGDPRLPPSCDVAPVALRSVIALYGIPDTVRIYDHSPSLALVHDASALYIGGTLAQYPDRYTATSPMTYIGPLSPPTILLLGADDRIVPSEQLGILDAAMRRAGATSEIYLLPATDHGFDVNWGGFATQFARAKIADFLQRYR
jgi:acetyl esterase/lipase